MEEIAELIQDLSGDNPKDVIETAMKKLLQMNGGQVDQDILIPLIEDAVRNAASKDDFIWIAYINELVQEMGIEEFLNPRTIRLLRVQELMLSDMQF